jgi:uncharacterized protein (DUF1697 family)
MDTYISMLRGINVSGSRMIKMDTLKKIYEDAGFKNVQTYIQSGNLVFQSEKTALKELEEKIAKIILEETSWELPVFVMTWSDLKETLNKNPFLLNRKEDINFLHVTFLSGTPAKENTERIKGSYLTDEYMIMGKKIYLFCPNGYGRTKLSNNFFENKLKLAATTRNWKTINELANIAEGFR